MENTATIEDSPTYQDIRNVQKKYQDIMNKSARFFIKTCLQKCFFSHFGKHYFIRNLLCDAVP
jgi:hypothetical protein